MLRRTAFPLTEVVLPYYEDDTDGARELRGDEERLSAFWTSLKS